MDLRKARGDLLHHRWRLDRSILTDVDTLYCSFVVLAAVRRSSPQLNSPIMYSCILQLHVTGTLLFHLARDIDMYHVSTIQIHSDVQLYSCTAVRPYPAEIRRPFVDKYRIRIPYSGILNCTII
jgi:hypothetical protein